MKGQVITEVPSELASAASDGRVVSADGVYDYIQQKNQEDLNKEFINNEKTTAQALNKLNTEKVNKLELSNLEKNINSSLIESEQIISESINQLNNTKANKIDLDNKADLEDIDELNNIIQENEKLISNTLNLINNNKVNKSQLEEVIRNTMNTIIENEQIISNAINELNRTKASVKDLDNLFETVYLLEQRVTNLE